MSQRIYLDYAASTPVDPEALAYFQEVATQYFGNPSSIHAEGRKSRYLIEESRKKIASLLQCSVNEIFFTSCGTESANMIIDGCHHGLGIRHFVYNPLEHPCVIQKLKTLKNVQLHRLSLLQDGSIDIDHLEAILQRFHEPALVICMHGNNELGIMNDIDAVGTICKKYQPYFFSDTVQTLGLREYQLSNQSIDFISGSAHKFFGFKGTGLLYIRNTTNIPPLLLGGHQERNMRAGTENIAGIASMVFALEKAYHSLPDRLLHLQKIKSHFIELLNTLIPGVKYYCHPTESLEKILSVSFPPHPKNEMLLLQLDIAGISASGGAACSSGAETLSHVIDFVETDPLRRMIRFSFSHHTTMDEIQHTVQKIGEILN